MLDDRDPALGPTLFYVFCSTETFPADAGSTGGSRVKEGVTFHLTMWKTLWFSEGQGSWSLAKCGS